MELITLKTYCPKMKRPLDIQDMIRKNVEKEDALNHDFTPIEIPEMIYPKSGLPTLTSKYAFFSQIGKILLP